MGFWNTVSRRQSDSGESLVCNVECRALTPIALLGALALAILTFNIAFYGRTWA